MLKVKDLPRCPSCKRKGLHYEDHPHAYGRKVYDRVICRFCGQHLKLSVKH